jgi:hypothetical protein
MNILKYSRDAIQIVAFILCTKRFCASSRGNYAAFQQREQGKAPCPGHMKEPLRMTGSAPRGAENESRKKTVPFSSCSINNQPVIPE